MKANPYETDRYLHEYLLFHYGKPKDLFPFDLISPELLRFHERIREECLLPIANSGHARALDIGCAVGRVIRSNPALLCLLTANRYIPVVACMAADAEGRIQRECRSDGCRLRRRLLR